MTTPARTVFDLAAVLTRRALERAIDEAARLKHFDLEALETLLQAYPKRVGRAKLAAVLEQHRPGSTPTRSPLEERFFHLCSANGLPQPEVNVPIGPYTVDFLWRAQRLAVETDGRANHSTPRAFEHDRSRDAYLIVRGLRVVRYTHRRIERDPAGILSELRRLLESGEARASAARAPGPRGPSAGSRTA